MSAINTVDLKMRFFAPGLFYVLFNSNNQSPSWVAGSSSSGEEVLRHLWKPKFYYRDHNNILPMNANLSQMNPVDALKTI
jgi:hypothetical protein